MADLRSLSRRVAATKAKQSEPPKKKVTPRVDRSVEKAIKASEVSISGALKIGFKSLEAQLKKILNRDDKVVAQIDDKLIEKAVVRGMEKAKPQKITFPAREPVTYRATIQRRGKEMTGALIEPVTK